MARLTQEINHHPALTTIEIWCDGKPITDWPQWCAAQRALGWPERAHAVLRLALVPEAHLNLHYILHAARRGEL